MVEQTSPKDDVAGLIEQLLLVGKEMAPLSFGKGYTVIEQAATALQTLTDKVERLEGALGFYATEWRSNEGSPLGHAVPAMSPTHALVCDYGNRARATLTKDGM